MWFLPLDDTTLGTNRAVWMYSRTDSPVLSPVPYGDLVDDRGRAMRYVDVTMNRTDHEMAMHDSIEAGMDGWIAPGGSE